MPPAISSRMPCAVSVISTARSPPMITYTPPSNAMLMISSCSGTSGNSTASVIAPANMAPDASMNMAVNTVKPEKIVRDRRSYRFSNYSGAVETLVCR